MRMRTRLATSNRLPRKCRKKIGGQKAAILNEQSEKLAKSLYVTHLIKHMRVVEKIFKDRFELDWDEAWDKYGPIIINDEDDDQGANHDFSEDQGSNKVDSQSSLPSANKIEHRSIQEAT